jgi:acetyl esterase/lipase
MGNQHPPEPTRLGAGEPASSSPHQGRGRRLASIGALISRILLAIIFIGGLCFSLVPLGRAAARSASLFPSLITQSDPAPLVLASDPVRHSKTTISSQDGTVYLDFYAPTTSPPPIPGSRAAVVIIPGVGDNRHIAPLVSLLTATARAGLVVVALTTRTLIDFSIAPATTDAVVQTVLLLQHYPGVNPRSVGIVGLSAGGTPAVLAAANPKIQKSLAFVTLFGSYYDARTMVRDVGRRAQEVDRHLEPWMPAPVPIRVLTNIIAGAFSNGDGAVLRSGINSTSGIALSTSEVASLTPPAQAAYHLLAGDQPSRVGANLDLLPTELQELLVSLSPSSVVGQIRAPVYLLHDRDDPLVPFTQSVEFAAKLAEIGHPYRYVELSIFRHTTVQSGLGIGPLLRDGAALYVVLTQMLNSAS